MLTHLTTHTVGRFPIRLTVWPIAAECVASQVKAFGAAYGFDHSAVSKIYGADNVAMMRTMLDFTAKRHVSANSLDLWRAGAVNVTKATVSRLLESQDVFLADAMYLTPTDTKYLKSPPDQSWIEAKLAVMEDRVGLIQSWG